jgi:periodic tryptophan protein 1
LNDADIDRIKEIAHIELEDARTEIERANIAAQDMDERHEELMGDDIEDDDDDSAWVEYVLRPLPADGRLKFCSEPMEEDTSEEGTVPKRNGDLSEYKLDTYDEDDEGPASSASGHAIFGITTICPAQLLVPSPT